MQPIEVVKAGYEAFGQGDVLGVLSLLAEDVSPSDPASGRPCRTQVAELFRGLNERVELSCFEVGDFVATGPEVVSFGRFSGRARNTGRPFASSWAMRWHVDGERVKLHKAFVDTHAIARALAV